MSSRGYKTGLLSQPSEEFLFGELLFLVRFCVLHVLYNVEGIPLGKENTT